MELSCYPIFLHHILQNHTPYIFFLIFRTAITFVSAWSIQCKYKDKHYCNVVTLVSWSTPKASKWHIINRLSKTITRTFISIIGFIRWRLNHIIFFWFLCQTFRNKICFRLYITSKISNIISKYRYIHT